MIFFFSSEFILKEKHFIIILWYNAESCNILTIKYIPII